MTTRVRQGVLALLAAAALSVSAALLMPGFAQAATWTNYCNNQKLPGWQESGSIYCYGANRVAHELMGWGDQHSVCIGMSYMVTRCSGGPGAGVYTSSELGYWIAGTPWIENQAPGWNVVHGRSLVE